MILIIDINDFKWENREALLQFYKKNNVKEISRQYIALRFNSDAELINLEINQLKLMPSSLRSYYLHYGIIGVRFIKNKIEYFIDIENMIFHNQLFFMRKGQ